MIIDRGDDVADRVVEVLHPRIGTREMRAGRVHTVGRWSARIA